MSGDVEAPSYAALRRAMADVPLGDGEEWLAALLTQDAALAVRVMGVRAAYAADFDYAILAGLTAQAIERGNAALMRRHVRATAGDSAPSDDGA